MVNNSRSRSPQSCVMPSHSNIVRMRSWFGALLLIIGRLCPALGADAHTNSPRQQLEFYEKQVQPILAENCYKCHSHQAEKIKGSFVLDSREGLLKGGE